jgi:hypothetical protein
MAYGTNAAATVSSALSSNLDPEIQAGREEARYRKYKAEETLRQSKALAPTEQDLETQKDIDSQTLLKLQQELKQTRAKNAEMAVYDAGSKYLEDGDVRHLNTAVEDAKSTQFGQSIFRDVAAINPITSSDKDKQLIETTLGVSPDLLLADPKLAKKYVKVSRPDGTESLVDIMAVLGGTRFQKYAKKADLEYKGETEKLEAAIVTANPLASKDPVAAKIYMRLAAEGVDMSTDAGKLQFIKEFEEAENEKYLREVALKKAGLKPDTTLTTNPYFIPLKTAEERNIGVRALKELVDQGSSAVNGSPEFFETYNRLLAESNKEKSLGGDGKKLAAANDAVARIEAASQQLTGKRFLDPSLTVKDVKAIQESAGPEFQLLKNNAKINASLEKKLVNLKSMIEAGSNVAKMTEEQTGVFDAWVFDKSKFVSDSPEGVEALSNYSIIRNAMRNELFGAALTEKEIESFYQSYGSNMQKLGPMLEAFKANINYMKTQINSIGDTVMDKHVFKALSGGSVEQAQTVVNNLDKLISRVSGKAPKDSATPLAPERKAEIDQSKVNRSRIEAIRARKRAEAAKGAN